MMDVPENLTMLLYDGCEPTPVRDHVADRITSPEIYHLIEVRSHGTYARARYAWEGGLGDHLVADLVRVGDRWGLMSATFAERSIEDPNDGMVAVITSEGIERFSFSDAFGTALGPWY